ncbi:hypothetical protein MTO96_007679 [Rhipicephalus appendiculatus]
MQRRINATKKLVKRAISERSELRSRNTTSDIAEIVESRGDLAKFTIEAYFIVDDELHKRLRSAGRTIQQYARRFAIEVTKLLWQLRPRGCLVVVGAETISPEDNETFISWPDNSGLNSKETLQQVNRYCASKNISSKADVVLAVTGRQMYRQTNGQKGKEALVRRAENVCAGADVLSLRTKKRPLQQQMKMRS